MNRNRIRIPLLVVAAGLFLPSAAETLTPQQALGRLLSAESGRKLAPGGAKLTLAHTAYAGQANVPAYYIFDKPEGGYLIVTADDRLVTLLADVDKGRFNPESVPANIQWWLSEYEREIDWFLTEGHKAAEVNTLPAASRIIMQDKRVDVEPLLETKWDQADPYNLKCPEIGDKKAPTGCVATAMAQILNYHRWPETHGTGQHTYTYRGKQYSFDYASTAFDWNNMRTSYSGAIATEAQKEAVATLMYACGVGVNMEYEDDQSGAASYRIAPALRDFFDYPECTSYVIRDTYSLWEWEELIYQEMAAGRPVCYSGFGGMGGHQFVADGYRADNLFHINWGWSGVSDGYFRLSSLNPPILGIGGGGGSFDYNQEAVVMICRPEQAEGLKPVTPTYISGNFSISSIERGDDEGAYLRLGFPGGGMYANVAEDLPGQFGVLVTDEFENEIGWYAYQDITFPAGTEYGHAGYHSASAFVPRLKENGTYRVYPAFLPTEGEWTRIPVYNGFNRFITLIIEDNWKMNFQNTGLTELPELEVVDLIVKSDIYKDTSTTLLVDCLNGNANYAGQLHLYLAGGEGQADRLLGSMFLEMTPSLYNLYTFEVTFDVEPGEYSVYFADCLNRRISSNFDVKVLPAGAGVALTATDKAYACWFDMRGNRLPERPSCPGIYLCRQGGKVMKVVVR